MTKCRFSLGLLFAETTRVDRHMSLNLHSLMQSLHTLIPVIIKPDLTAETLKKTSLKYHQKPQMMHKERVFELMRVLEWIFCHFSSKGAFKLDLSNCATGRPASI